MDFSFLTKEFIAAVGTLLVAIGVLIAKVWGSGKERMDFQNVNREALRNLLKDLQESFKAALLENKELRNKWNLDLTSWELEKKAQEKIEDELLSRALSAESQAEFLLERIRLLEIIIRKGEEKTTPSS